MEMVDDPKRTGVRATMIKWAEPPMYLKNDRWHGPHGAFVEVDNSDHWLLCCPGCGEMGTPRAGHVWRVVNGSWSDVSTLTLEPSIQKHCCGWHGFLTNGVLESC